MFTFDYRNHGRSESVSRAIPPEVTRADMADSAAVRLAAVHSDTARCQGSALSKARTRCERLPRSLRFALVLDSIQPRRRDLRSTRLLNRSWLPVRLFVRRRDDRVDLARAAQKLRAATLIVHGQDDVDVPLQFSRNIAARVPSECQLWVVPQARHAEAVEVAAAAYRARIVDFFTRTMQTAPCARGGELPRVAPCKAIPGAAPPGFIGHGARNAT